MRRKDREVTNSDAVREFIDSEQIMRIGFYDNGEIYIVPVNFGYTFESGEYTFYFHGAKAGRKYALCKSLPDVGFEIDGDYSLISADSACEYSAQYKIVIGNGTAEIIDDIEEKKFALACITKKGSQRLSDFLFSACQKGFDQRLRL